MTRPNRRGAFAGQIGCGRRIRFFGACPFPPHWRLLRDAAANPTRTPMTLNKGILGLAALCLTTAACAGGDATSGTGGASGGGGNSGGSNGATGGSSAGG